MSARACRRRTSSVRSTNSLKRLNTDRIDLFQSHRDDPDTPQEETLSTYDGLIKAGKLRYIGASNFEAPRLAEAAKIAKEKGLPGYVSLQPHYNLMERGLFEGALESECLKEGIGVIPYYSLASGFLSGKYKSEADAADKARSAGVKKYLNDKGFGVLKALDAAARKHNANSDAGGARLADAAQGDHRADRQRHQPRPAQGPGRRARDQARSGVGRRHRQGERAGVMGRTSRIPSMFLSSARGSGWRGGRRSEPPHPVSP